MFKIICENVSNYTVRILKEYKCSSRFASTLKSDEKNVLCGGDLKKNILEGSIGKILFDAMKNEDRADKILQVSMETKEEMTTKEFLRQSVGVAQGLCEREVQLGSTVLVVSNNNPMLNICILGIMFHGCTAAVMSAETTQSDMKILLKHLKPSFFFGEEKAIHHVRRLAREVLGSVKTDRAILFGPKGESTIQPFKEFLVDQKWEEYMPSKIRSTREDLAIITRSSHTPVPSAVGLTHKNLAVVLTRYAELYDPAKMANEVSMQIQKVIWMSGLYTLLLSCYFGMKMIVVNEFQEEPVLKAIAEHKVSWLYMHPTKVWKLLKYPDITKYDITSCKHMHIVGAKMASTLVEKMMKKTGVEIAQVYGDSETGSVTDPALGQKVGSVGKLVPGTLAKVVSKTRDENLGPNQVGELCFKGAGIMRGYVDNDKLTKSIMDRFGFLHTGDAGSYDSDGYFYMIDRIQSLIRVGDVKFSPQDIEQVIISMESVRDVAVAGITHTDGGKTIMAFVVKRPDSELKAEDIIKFVADKLEAPKRIGGVIFVNKVPHFKQSSDINRDVLHKILRKYRLKSQPKKDEGRKEQITREETKVEQTKIEGKIEEKT